MIQVLTSYIFGAHNIGIFEFKHIIIPPKQKPPHLIAVNGHLHHTLNLKPGSIPGVMILRGGGRGGHYEGHASTTLVFREVKPGQNLFNSRVATHSRLRVEITAFSGFRV